jgi:hypothetical protein
MHMEALPGCSALSTGSVAPLTFVCRLTHPRQCGGPGGQPTRASEDGRLLAMTHDQRADLERQGWEALSADGESARAFYAHVLDDTVMMLLPGGIALGERVQIIESMSGTPWSRYALDDLRTVHPTPDTGLVTYGVLAARGDAEYAALVSSFSVRRDGRWRLAFHQQTPR